MVKPVHALFATTMIGLNLMIGFVVATLNLPIYLDSVGIILTGILAGPVLAAAVGVGTTLVGWIVIKPYLWAFTGTAVVIGVLSGLFARHGFFSKLWKVPIAGLAIALSAAIVSAPVVAFMFGGATGAGSDALTALFRSMGNSIVKSVFLSGFTSEIFDKPTACLLAFFIGRSLSRRTLQWFPGAAERLGRRLPAE